MKILSSYVNLAIYRNGVFKDGHGNVKAQRTGGNIIRSIDCPGLVQAVTHVLCERCRSYRKCLLTMLLKEKYKEYRTASQFNQYRSKQLLSMEAPIQRGT